MPFINLKTNKLEYQMEIRHKYSLIRGLSGCGKTKFYELVTTYAADKYSVRCEGYSKIVSLPMNSTDLGNYKELENYVIVMDEDCVFLHQADTASMLKNSNNYFVIISRSVKFNYLPIELDDIFLMKSSGKYHFLEPFYSDEMRYRDYISIDFLYCEDSNSGKRFLSELFPNLKIDDAAGKDNLVNKIKSGGYRNIAIILDSIGISTEFDNIYNEIIDSPNYNVFLVDWYSFEGHLLKYKNFEPDFMESIDRPIEDLEEYIYDKLKLYLPRLTKKNLNLMGYDGKIYVVGMFLYDRLKELKKCLNEEMQIF